MCRRGLHTWVALGLLLAVGLLNPARGLRALTMLSSKRVWAGGRGRGNDVRVVEVVGVVRPQSCLLRPGFYNAPKEWADAGV